MPGDEDPGQDQERRADGEHPAEQKQPGKGIASVATHRLDVAPLVRCDDGGLLGGGFDDLGVDGWDRGYLAGLAMSTERLVVVGLIAFLFFTGVGIVLGATLFK